MKKAGCEDDLGLGSTDAPRPISNPPVKLRKDTKENASMQPEASSQPAKCMVTACIKYIAVRVIASRNKFSLPILFSCYTRALCWLSS